MKIALASALFVLAGTATAQTVYPTGTTIYEPTKAFNGYTLFAPSGATEAVLIDMAGNVVNTWESPVPGESLANVVPLEDGHILAYGQAPANGPKQTAYEFDVAGNVVWSYTLDPQQGYFHHDAQKLENGNYLLLCAQTITVPSISPLPLEDDFILEVDGEGLIVGSFYTWQHFDEFGFSEALKQVIYDNGGDWAHANAADELPPNDHTDPALAAGNIIVSQRFTNVIFIADRQTGNIVWQSGPDDNLTWGQHNPHMIEQGLPGAGNILVFDNGAGTGYLPGELAPGESYVEEIDPLTSTVVWSYGAANSGLFRKLFWSDIVSNAQRLENGNTLICSGTKGRLFEVTNSGEIVWEYMSPYFSNSPAGKNWLVYRAYRVPLDWAYFPYHREPGLKQVK